MALAWVQLTALALPAAYGMLVVSVYWPGRLDSFAAMQLLVLGSAVAAVVTAHRHRRGVSTRAAVITTLVGAFVNAVAINGALLT